MSDASNIINQYVQRLTDQLQKAKQEAVTMFQRKWSEYASIKLEQFFTEAIHNFYIAYTPLFYHRTYSMYDILEIQASSDGIIGFFDESNMSQHQRGHSADSTLYTTTFKFGFHGGAWTTRLGIPRWRTPYNVYKRWGRIAAHSMPPWEYLRNKAEDFRNGDAPRRAQVMYDTCKRTVFDRYGIKG